MIEIEIADNKIVLMEKESLEIKKEYKEEAEDKYKNDVIKILEKEGLAWFVLKGWQSAILSSGNQSTLNVIAEDICPHLTTTRYTTAKTWCKRDNMFVQDDDCNRCIKLGNYRKCVIFGIKKEVEE